MPNPQLGRAELHDLTAARIPSDPLTPIDPLAVREVVDNLIDSSVNRADDGGATPGTGAGTPGPAEREYSTILAGHWGLNDPPTSLPQLNQALDYLRSVSEAPSGPTGATVVLTDLPGARRLLANIAPAPKVERAAFYVIDGDWNATGNDARVYVLGLAPNAFDVVGTLESPQGTYAFVKIDIGAGTTEPVAKPTAAAAVTQQQMLALLEEGPGISITPHNGRVLISNTVAAIPSQQQPAAPADGRVDDTGNTLSGLLVPGFPAAADYEVFGVPGQVGLVNLAAAGGNAEGGRIYSRGLTGEIAIEATGIRVAASGARPAGKWLLNNRAFTGPAVNARGYQPTYTATYPAAV